jgi:hypothetical protein
MKRKWRNGNLNGDINKNGVTSLAACALASARRFRASNSNRKWREKTAKNMKNKSNV